MNDDDKSYYIGLLILVMILVGSIGTLIYFAVHNQNTPDFKHYPPKDILVTGCYQDGDYCYIEGNQTNLYRIHDDIFNFIQINDTASIIPCKPVLGEWFYWIVLSVNDISYYLK